jgi:DnaK suppressor protein
MAKNLKVKAARKEVKATTKKSTAKRIVRSAKATKPPVKKPVTEQKKGYNKADLEHFRSIILEKRKQIVEELELIHDSLSDNSGGDYFEENSPYSLHMEQGTDTMEREKNYLLAARQRKFLEYLDDALKRIDKGVYGFCLDCGKLIEKARLEAVPHAQLCVSCKIKRGQ